MIQGEKSRGWSRWGPTSPSWLCSMNRLSKEPVSCSHSSWAWVSLRTAGIQLSTKRSRGHHRIVGPEDLSYTRCHPIVISPRRIQGQEDGSDLGVCERAGTGALVLPSCVRYSLPPRWTICSTGPGGVCAALLLPPVKLLASPRLAGVPVGEVVGSRCLARPGEREKQEQGTASTFLSKLQSQS